MMNILHFSQSVKWSSWFICSLLLHGLIFLAFIWRFSEVQPAMSPAPAIMLQWAEIIEAPSSPLSLPVGIAQQESAVTEEKQQTEDRQQRPVTEDSDATRDGKQLGYVHTGAGANAVKYNPKYNELYVTNFTSGTISVVDATKYSITREFNMPVYPNQMVLSDDMDTLYIGIKEGFNRDWDPDVFVEGAKERILSIDLKKS